MRARIETPVAAADPAELLRALGRRPQTVLLATKVGAIHGLAPALGARARPPPPRVPTPQGGGAPRGGAPGGGRGHGRPRDAPGAAPRRSAGAAQ